MKSVIKLGEKISFPCFTHERAYMIPFKKNNIPKKYSRWEKTINTMLKGIDTNDTIYLTIDQKTVNKGNTHRREGPHIDGNYIDNGWDTGPTWNTKNNDYGGIILASDKIGCKAYEGIFDGTIGEGGDCSNIDLSNAKISILQPYQIYIGNVTMIHETIPALETQKRTFVRLTLPESYHNQ